MNKKGSRLNAHCNLPSPTYFSSAEKIYFLHTPPYKHAYHVKGKK